MFEAVDGGLYFTAQWYYRAKDTVSFLFCHFIYEIQTQLCHCYQLPAIVQQQAGI